MQCVNGGIKPYHLVGGGGLGIVYLLSVWRDFVIQVEQVRCGCLYTKGRDQQQPLDNVTRLVCMTWYRERMNEDELDGHEVSV